MSKAKKPEVVYGGPYAEESAAIIAESRKEKPDYEALTANWNTISNGAIDFIERQKEGFERPVGEFVNNVELTDEQKEPEVPEIHLYASNKEVSEEDAAKLGEEEAKKTDEEKQNSESSDLEKELGL